MPRPLLQLLLLAVWLYWLPLTNFQNLRADEPLEAAPATVAAPATAAENSSGAASVPSDNEKSADVALAGHSLHGEAFNEGPRQAAYLMDGLGTIQFDISTSQSNTKKFFNQGVAQLHGFWYYEAERSFRQAAAFDRDCAMTYWGMALANVNNRKRAAAFIAQAVERKAAATEREGLYIESARRRFQENADSKKLSKKEIAQNYTHDLEEIVLRYPHDIEANALLALQLWENERNDLPVVSHVAIEAVLQDVFDKQPMHPAHHYRIHLWDKRKPAQALQSAALCGPSLPAIAHMWHMPGHIYSNLNRFHDAVWQQEASARVDHAHMMRDHVLPDQIHNFAHNNEWMIRNLLKIGRVQDAIGLATNMIHLPRHPKYNSLKSGSAKYGRERLLQTLSTYRLWPELIAAIDSGLIEPGSEDESQIELRRHAGIAFTMLDRSAQAGEALADLKSRLHKVDHELKSSEANSNSPTKLAARPDAGCPPAPTNPSAAITPSATGCDEKYTDEKENDEKENDEKDNDERDKDERVTDEEQASDDPDDKQKADANQRRRDRERSERKKELESRQKQLNEAIAAIEAAQAAVDGQWDRALELFDKAGNWDKLLKAEWLARAQKLESALELAEAQIKDNPGTVLPRAISCYVRWQARGALDAQSEFDHLREAACESDLDTPLLARLDPLANELGHDSSWAKSLKPSTDIGQRPALDTLGPTRYAPYVAPTWSARSRDGLCVESSKYSGKPVVVIFYLGFGCLHCIEQLQKFSPLADKFSEEGIELVGISSESSESLAKGLDAYSKPLSIPLMADSELKTFQAFRCYDDFEKQPLHGTFLIDAQGNVLWQDISFEPFQDAEFLLKESQRLLKLKAKE